MKCGNGIPFQCPSYLNLQLNIVVVVHKTLMTLNIYRRSEKLSTERLKDLFVVTLLETMQEGLV